MPANPPSIVGRYRIVKPLGEGRLGPLYLATDPTLDREVALRLVPPLPGDLRARVTSDVVARARLQHPKLATFYDYGDHDGRFYIVRAYIAGRTLREILDAHTPTLPIIERLRWMEDACSALAYAHRAGLSGLSFRPEEVIIGDDRQAVLLDVGLRAAFDEGSVDLDPSYSSPEALTGGDRDQRSDIFSAGAVLYELLTYEKPFGVGTAAAIAQRVVNADWNRDVLMPANLARVIERALQLDPADRYQTFDDLRSDLGRARFALEGLGADRAVFIPAPIEPPTSGHWVGQSDEEFDPANYVDVESPRRIDDNVRFTVYRPAVMAPQRWYPLLFFTHLAERRPDAPPDEPDPSKQVEIDARDTLGAVIASFPRLAQDAGVGIPHEALLQIKPSVPGLTFNPPEYSFLWVDDVHKTNFTVRADASLEGRIARGSIEVRMGAIPVALITVAIPIEVRAPAQEPPVQDVAAPYRRIFASYSHRDSAIVQQFENYARGIGDSYMRDVIDLRAGEIWSDRLLELIDAADVFQLFWSTHSMDSPFVRREWEHALTVNRPQFVRPLYWETPFPEREGLPPPELKARHFASVAVADATDLETQRAEEARRRRADQLQLMVEAAKQLTEQDALASLNRAAALNPELADVSRLRAELERAIAAKKAEEQARLEAEEAGRKAEHQRAAEEARHHAEAERKRNEWAERAAKAAPAREARHDRVLADAPPPPPPAQYVPDWSAGRSADSLPKSMSSRTPIWGIGLLLTAIVIVLALFFTRC